MLVGELDFKHCFCAIACTVGAVVDSLQDIAQQGERQRYERGVSNQIFECKFML